MGSFHENVGPLANVVSHLRENDHLKKDKYVCFSDPKNNTPSDLRYRHGMDMVAQIT
jgi:hypothetical protein